MSNAQERIKAARDAMYAQLMAAGYGVKHEKPVDPPAAQAATPQEIPSSRRRSSDVDLQQLSVGSPKRKWEEDRDSILGSPEPELSLIPLAEPPPIASASTLPVNMSSLGRIRKRSKAEASTSNVGGGASSSHTSGSASPLTSAAHPETGSSKQERSPPEWYRSVKIPKKDASGTRPLVARLRHIRDLIKACKASPRAVNPAQLDKIRTELHELEFIKVDAVVLHKARLLHNEDGLPQIFDPDYTGGVTYPWDIRSDAEELYNKWYQEMFDPYMFRGLKLTGGKGAGKHKAWSLDEDYPRVSSNYWGAGLLINGQWWPNQLCGLRDGAHGSAQGGIHGMKGKGAYSIVLSGSHYQDRDEGDEIWYCGTDGKDDGVITDATQRMIESTGSDRPVRVLRSEKLPATNPYKPVRGYRYDGLYDVLDCRCVESTKQIHLFHLRRRAGQDPIRCAGVEARPTPQEIATYDDLREKLGFTT